MIFESFPSLLLPTKFIVLVYFFRYFIFLHFFADRYWMIWMILSECARAFRGFPMPKSFSFFSLPLYEQISFSAFCILFQLAYAALWDFSTKCQWCFSQLERSKMHKWTGDICGFSRAFLNEAELTKCLIICIYFLSEYRYFDRMVYSRLFSYHI